MKPQTTGSTAPSTRAPLAAYAFGLFFLLQLHPLSAPLGLPALLLGFGLAALRGQIDFGRRFDRVDGALLVFAATWLLCSAMALDPQRAFELSVPVAVALFSSAALRRTDRRMEGLEVLLLALAFVAAGLATTACALYLLDPRPAEALVSAIGSPWLVVPNDLAWAPCLWPLWSSRWRKLNRPLWPLVLLWALLLCGMIVLQSRLGLLLLAVVTMGDHVRRGQPWLRRLLLVAGGLALALLLIWLFDKGLGGITARLQLWLSAWSLFLQHPWLGIGPHGFVLAYPELIASLGAVDPRLTPWPHSLPLELLAEGGIVMAMAASLLLFSARDAWWAWSRSPAPASFLLLCLVEASTLRLWLWVLLVLLLLLSGARTSERPR